MGADAVAVAGAGGSPVTGGVAGAGSMGGWVVGFCAVGAGGRCSGTDAETTLGGFGAVWRLGAGGADITCTVSPPRF